MVRGAFLERTYDAFKRHSGSNPLVSAQVKEGPVIEPFVANAAVQQRVEPVAQKIEDLVQIYLEPWSKFPLQETVASQMALAADNLTRAAAIIRRAGKMQEAYWKERQNSGDGA